MSDSNEEIFFSLDSSSDDVSAGISISSASRGALEDLKHLIDWVNHYDANHENIPGPGSSRGNASTMKKRFKEGFTFLENAQTELKESSENVKNLKNRLKRKRTEVKTLKRKCAKLEEERRQKKKALNSNSPARVWSNVEALFQFFQMVVSKIEKQPKSLSNTIIAPEDMENFKGQVYELFHRVQHELKKWEREQQDMEEEIASTRIAVERLHEMVVIKERLLLERGNVDNSFVPMASNPWSSGQGFGEALVRKMTPSTPTETIPSEPILYQPAISPLSETNFLQDSVPSLSPNYVGTVSVPVFNPEIVQKPKKETAPRPSVIQKNHQRRTEMGSILRPLLTTQPTSLVSVLPISGNNSLSTESSPLNFSRTPSTTVEQQAVPMSNSLQLTQSTSVWSNNTAASSTMSESLTRSQSQVSKSKKSRKNCQFPTTHLNDPSSGAPCVSSNESTSVGHTTATKHSLPPIKLLTSTKIVPIPVVHQREAVEIFGGQYCEPPPKPTGGKGRNICSVCGMSFNTLVQMKLHQTVVHLKNPAPASSVAASSSSSHSIPLRPKPLVFPLPPPQVVHQEPMTEGEPISHQPPVPVLNVVSKPRQQKRRLGENSSPSSTNNIVGRSRSSRTVTSENAQSSSSERLPPTDNE